MTRQVRNLTSDPSRSLQAMQLEALLPQCVQVSVQWVKAMSDPAELHTVLHTLSDVFDAATVSIARYEMIEDTSHLLHSTDLNVTAGPSFAFAFAQAGRVMPGQILSLREFSEASGTSQSATRPQPDSLAIVLSASDLRTEALEIQFRYPIQAEDRVILSSLAEHFSSSWSTASEPTNEIDALPRAASFSPSAILGPQNRFDLSRTELRVCKRVGQGKSPKDIADELGVTISTIRSHLKNIYAKTETSGQRALQHKLHNPDATRHAP